MKVCTITPIIVRSGGKETNYVIVFNTINLLTSITDL